MSCGSEIEPEKCSSSLQLHVRQPSVDHLDVEIGASFLIQFGHVFRSDMIEEVAGDMDA